MSKTEKKINKWLIGIIIGTTLLGVGGLSMTKKGRNFRKSFVSFTKRLGEKLASFVGQTNKKK